MDPNQPEEFSLFGFIYSAKPSSDEHEGHVVSTLIKQLRLLCVQEVKYLSLNSVEYLQKLQTRFNKS